MLPVSIKHWVEARRLLDTLLYRMENVHKLLLLFHNEGWGVVTNLMRTRALLSVNIFSVGWMDGWMVGWGDMYIYMCALQIPFQAKVSSASRVRVCVMYMCMFVHVYVHV